MTRDLGRRPKRTTALGLSALVLALAAACGGSSSGGATASSGSTNQQAPSAGASGATSATLAALYKGTLTAPSSASRPAAKGKKIVIISAGQSSISSSIPVNAAQAAAKAMGWQSTIYDGQLNPANAPGLVRQAISSGANGIILDSVDCPTAKAAMQEAKAKGIVLIPLYSFDCNDPLFGGGGPGVFNASINYGVSNADVGKFTEKYGAAQADAVIAATHGQAKVIFFNDLEVSVLKYTGKGFLDELAKCSGCKVVDNVQFTGAELGSALQQKATSALLQHPEANAVKSPYTSATILGIAPAVAQSGRSSQIYVMGGEGFAPELDLVRAHQGVNAAMVVPSDWTGWAAVDTMNSVFIHQPPAVSGLGWQLVDSTHNLPASGGFVPKVDYQAIYKKAWGVG